MLSSKFLTGMIEADEDEPGLVLAEDGTIWVVAADGTRTELQGEDIGP